MPFNKHRPVLKWNFILLLSLVIISMKPEVSHSQKIGLGAAAGLNFSSHLNNFKFNLDDVNLDFSPEFTNGWQAGIVSRHYLSNNLRLQFEPSFIQLGAGYSDFFIMRGVEFQTFSSTELNYIHLPILLQLTTAPPDRGQFPRPWPEFTFHLTSGIYGSYLFDAKFSGTNRGGPIGIEFEEAFENEITKQYKNRDVGIVLGAGSEFGLNTKVGLETRFMLGVLSSGNRPDLEFNPHNMAVTFGLYFLF
ncbi:porin family protein [Rhodohalobacter sp. 8-1]|uniref:porin family protein n=1 Tax=Rhodohalobacter sp. 8-1 TaxID=3131972 RepID=UPI0030EE0990